MTLDPLYRVLGYLLAVFYVPFHNLGIATILLTVVIMLIQFPLTAKQARSMIQMQRVQPEIKKIQQKYKDDKQKQNEELLKFYQENGINPLAGCLPILITLPIGIAVFRTFSRGVQHHLPRGGALGRLYTDICHNATSSECGKQLAKHTPKAMRFLGVSLNLTARDAQKIGFGTALPYFVLVGFVVLTGWYQVRQTQARQLQSGNTPPNAQMQAMTKVFPVVFGLITLGLNAGATLYFVVSNIWRIGQQHFVIGKLYDQAVEKGELKPRAEKDSGGAQAGGAARPSTEAANDGGNGAAKGGTKPKGSGPAPKGTAGKNPPAKGSGGNGAGATGMTPGQRRKKRKR